MCKPVQSEAGFVQDLKAIKNLNLSQTDMQALMTQYGIQVPHSMQAPQSMPAAQGTPSTQNGSASSGNVPQNGGMPADPGAGGPNGGVPQDGGIPGGGQTGAQVTPQDTPRAARWNARRHELYVC